MRTENMQTGEKERQRDGDVKIESGPESGGVQPGQRWSDSSANKVESVKERGFSVELGDAVNPKESAIQHNIYSANRIKKRVGREGWMDGGEFLFLCLSIFIRVSGLSIKKLQVCK